MKITYKAFADISNREEKEELAARVAGRARPGERIGAGSGSTSYLTILALAERIKRENLEDILLVPSSLEVTWVIEECGLQVGSVGELDWLFDGADAVDPEGNLIKGRGGALLREKMLFGLTDKHLIAVDQSKFVPSLDGRPIPIEISPGSYPAILSSLENLGAEEASLRTGSGKDGPVITEGGNLLLDTCFPAVTDGLEKKMALLPGVVGSGLFQGYRVEIISGR